MTTVFTIGQHARLLLAEMLAWHWREARSVSAVGALLNAQPSPAVDVHMQIQT
jgi:hypothetical protein